MDNCSDCLTDLCSYNRICVVLDHFGGHGFSDMCCVVVVVATYCPTMEVLRRGVQNRGRNHPTFQYSWHTSLQYKFYVSYVEHTKICNLMYFHAIFRAFLPPIQPGFWQTLAIITVFSADILLEFLGRLTNSYIAPTVLLSFAKLLDDYNSHFATMTIH